MQIIKSIWLEADRFPDQYWIDALMDCGIMHKHEYICNCIQLGEEEVIKHILDANQICFSSAMIPWSASFHLLVKMMDLFLKQTIKDKRIISCTYLLDALNKETYFKDYAPIFNNNIICEVANFDKLKRIQHTGKCYEYTEIITP